MEEERRGCAVVAEDEAAANATPHDDAVAFERILGEIPLTGGDCIRVKWLRMHGSWPVLVIWFYRLGRDGTWLPIKNRGVRVRGPRVRALIDAINRAAPEEAAWRRHTLKQRRSPA